jgi:hypothetical protein
VFAALLLTPYYALIGFVVGLAGAICGWVGGALAHPTSIARTLRRYGPSA